MNHKELDVWKKSIVLVKNIYQLTQSFPDSEKYGLTSQIRRSAVSIPSNIAEGSARNSDKEFIHFLYYSMGSIAELETQLIISQELEYLSNDSIMNSIIEVRKMLTGLIKYLKSKK
jgi:four helix bundle protein